MSTSPDISSPTPSEQLDLLISRIADGEASAQDWTAFGALAERAPEAWKHLAQAQRDHQALSLAVGVALHAAERVELPSRDAADVFLRRARPQPVASRIRQYGGWAVAAAVALAWLGVNGGQFSLPAGKGPGTNTASMIPANYFKVTSPDDALQLYRDQGKREGRFLGEVPVLLESSPAATGKGYEVVYVRQIVERARVDNLLRFAQDESGKLIPVKVNISNRTGQAE
jgi:hypothetical protein